MVWTNLGKQRMFEEFFCSGAVDATFRVVLLDNTASSLSVDTTSTGEASLSGAVISSLPEIRPPNDGNLGGASGLVVLRDGTGDQANFDVSSASQLSASAARAVLQTANNAFQFSGAFSNARYVALVAAGEVDDVFSYAANKEIYAWWDIGSDTTIAAGNTLTITNLSLQGQ